MLQSSRAAAIAIALIMSTAMAPSASAGQYDGIYGGTTTIARNNGRLGFGEPLCSVTAVRSTWQVVEDVVQMNWNGSEWRVPVRPDGTISNSATLGTVSVSATGKITGNAMILFFGTEACGYRFEGIRGG
jgi:hypothetical protein